MFHWDKSAASFCRHVVSWVLDMFCNSYSVKNDTIADNPENPEPRDEISTNLEFIEFLKFLDVCLTKLKNNPIFLNKISHKFLVIRT